MKLRKRYSKGRASFVWVVDYHHHGKRIRVSTKTKKKKEAEEIAAKIQEQIVLEKRGILPSTNGTSPTRVHLEDFKIYYENYSVSNGKAKKTIEIFSQGIDNFMTVIGNLYLDEIGLKDIEYWKMKCPKMRSIGKLKRDSVSMFQRSLKTSFNVAKAHNYITHNPWNDAKIAEPSCSGNIPKIFEPDQIRKLLSIIAENDQQLLWMVKHLLYTGMRRAECIHLEVSDYDMKKSILHIQNKPHFNFKTKTKKNRHIRINDALQLVIQEMRFAGTFPDNGLVFRGARSGQVLNGNWLQRKFKRYVLQAGCDNELTLHNLRHTYATELLRAGSDIYPVTKFLGHSSVKTTEKYYAHAVAMDFEAEANLINYEDTKKE